MLNDYFDAVHKQIAINSQPSFLLFFEYDKADKKHIDNVVVLENNYHIKMHEIEISHKNVKWLDNLEEKREEARIEWLRVFQHYNQPDFNMGFKSVDGLNGFDVELFGEEKARRRGKYGECWRTLGNDEPGHFFPRRTRTSFCGLKFSSDVIWYGKPLFEDSEEGKCPICSEMFKKFRDGLLVWNEICLL